MNNTNQLNSIFEELCSGQLFRCYVHHFNLNFPIEKRTTITFSIDISDKKDVKKAYAYDFQYLRVFERMFMKEISAKEKCN